MNSKLISFPSSGLIIGSSRYTLTINMLLGLRLWLPDGLKETSCFVVEWNKDWDGRTRAYQAAIEFGESKRVAQIE